MTFDEHESGVKSAILVAVGGLVASGKSTVSRALAVELGAVRIEADELRAGFEQAGVSEALVPGFSDVVYRSMFEQAEKALADGRRVVLDGTFRSRERRARARELAARHDAAFRFVECCADEAVIRQRLREREDPEGWLAMFDHFLPLWEPVEELPKRELHRLDTSLPRAPIPDAARLGLESA